MQRGWIVQQIKTLFDLFRQTFIEWNEDKAPRLAAALAYYTAFSLAPLLVVIIAIVGFVVSQETVQARISETVTEFIGAEGAEFVTQMIDNAARPAEGIFATVVGLFVLLLGATGAFRQLQDALNTIWDIEEQPKPPKQSALRQATAFIRDKVLSFSMVLLVGFLLLMSVVASTFIAALNETAIQFGLGNEVALGRMNFALSFILITILFAMIFKFLPKISIHWRDVLLGAAFTSLMFSIGKSLLSLYLSNTGTTSAYGAAGSFVLILLWIYYSAQIVLFGAEFTQVYARRYGSQTHTVKHGASMKAASAPQPEQTSTAEPPAVKAFSGMRGVLVATGAVLVAILIGFFQQRAQPSGQRQDESN